MELNDDQYGKIARYLDGEEVELSKPEQAAADEVDRLARPLAGRLEFAPPPQVMQRITEKVISRLAHRRNRVIRLVPRAALAAAAGILLAAAVMYLIPRPAGPCPIAVELPPDVVAQVYAHGEQNMDLDLIGDELDALAAEIHIARAPAQFDTELNFLEEDVETFWLDEAEQWPDEI